ncbi:MULTISPECIES: hypothetical protein [Amycolatopsis]|uniref:Secreted protein n=1 Tax=Amycolatopsis tucumanensis TaxID=401106 RepID=A0ABP7HMN6_9PSEU|nr:MULTISPECIES: hypothetical protein [Amycolatopsis]MCF6423535.1 hypothetical protein [Amycolatopsis tucumanensis]
MTAAPISSVIRRYHIVVLFLAAVLVAATATAVSFAADPAGTTPGSGSAELTVPAQHCRPHVPC